MRKFIALFLLVCLASTDANSRSGGGHATKFDANIFGGSANVSCLVGASVAGVCATGYSATCNGTGSGDQTALTNWRNAVKGSSALAVLYIAPGSNCIFTSGDQLVWDGIGGSANWVQNSVIWAYGASANFVGIGGLVIPLTTGSVVACALSARISTVSAGSSTVTIPSGNMVNGSSATGVFAAGNPVLIAGIELQLAGYPPNFQRFEYGYVSSVSGNNITLGSPLINSYESTWPTFTSCASGADGAGPATIYKLVDSANTNYSIYGLTNIAPGRAQVGISGLNIRLYDVSIISGFPSASLNWWSFNSSFPSGSVQGMEVDKEVQFLNFFRAYIESFSIQSTSVQQLNIVSSQIGQTVGTPLNISVINSNLGALTHLGSTYGVGNSFYYDGTTIINVANLPANDLISYYAYSSGVFSFPLASANLNVSAFVPGGTYTLSYYVGGPSLTFCSPNYVFKVTDISTDGTSFFASTGAWTQDGSGIATPAALPALTNACGGNTANRVAGYAAATIKQVNSPAGSANITGYVAPY